VTRALRRLLVTWGLLVGTLPVPLAAQIEAQPGWREKQRDQEERPAPRMTKAPRILRQVSPVFPESAQREGRTGDVVVRITVDQEGLVARVDVLESAGSDLDWAVMGAVAGFLFEPAEVDGVPAPVQVDFRQRFTLTPRVTEVEVPSPPPAQEGASLPATQEVAQVVDVEDGPTPPPAPLSFRGIVRESGNKAPVVEAEVVVQFPGGEPLVATTGADGRFQLRGVPDGVGLVRVSATGYEAMFTSETFSSRELVEATYFVPRRSYNKFETVVRDRRPQKEVNRIQLRREEVSQVPGTFGDPLRVIENLPSMARAPALGGQLIVRGASPESTGVYFDGVQVPLLYHFGGLTSVVNAEFIENIDFFPGGFGASYGRATAGIVDVKTRSLQFGTYRASAKVDLFDAGFFLGGPLTLWGPDVDSEAPNPRRLTFAFAARRSYIDAIIPLGIALFMPPGMGTLTVAPIYWDYQGKLDYHPFAAHRFQLFAFGSDDSLKVIAGGDIDGSQFKVGTHSQFHRAVARWTWRIHPRVQNVVQAFTGWDLDNLGLQGGSLSVGRDTVTRMFGLRDELRYRLLDVVTLNVGLDYTVGSTALDSNIPGLGAGPAISVGAGGGGDGPGQAGGLGFSTTHFPRVFPLDDGGDGGFTGTTTFSEDTVSLNMAPYVEAEIGPILGLRLIPGFRLDYFRYGTSTRRLDASPRLAVRWEPVRGTVFKAAYGVYEQVPKATMVSPTFGNPGLEPERARHYIVGAEQQLTRLVRVTVNGFYNARDSVAVPSARVLGISDGTFQLEKYNNQGVGRSYGVDFLLRHELSKSFFGWVAYTLSRSENKDQPAGAWTLFPYDQTHILTVVAQYRLPWHLPFREWSRTGRLPRGLLWNTGWSILSGDVSVGGRFRAVTGNPTPGYLGSTLDLDTDEYRGIAADGDLFRMPAFHQLDVRVDYKMAFDNLLVNLYVDILNVYNRKNPEFIQWSYRYTDYTTVPLIPFLPIVGASAEF
jgi:TonB family protein